MPMLTFSRSWEQQLLDQTKKQTIRANCPYWFRQAGYRSDRLGSSLERLASLDPETAFRENRHLAPSHFANNDSVLHIWLGNPRTRAPWVRKLGRSFDKWTLRPIYGRDFSDHIAEMDGFGSAQELKQGLMELHGMTMGEVEEHLWVVIRWEWKEGPHRDHRIAAEGGS